MTILYNCHTDGDQYRITKFNDGEVESSYLCSSDECQCPAGSRPTCRHRMMLPMFLARGAVNSFWFLDFERKGWVSNEPAPLRIVHEISLPDDATGDQIAEAFGGLLHCERSELGSQQVDDTDNIDWDILAEERLGQRPHSPTATTAEFDSADGSSNLPAVAKAKWRRI